MYLNGISKVFEKNPFDKMLYMYIYLLFLHTVGT